MRATKYRKHAKRLTRRRLMSAMFALTLLHLHHEDTWYAESVYIGLDKNGANILSFLCDGEGRDDSSM